MSLLMVRKSAPAHAADKTEKIANDSEIVALWQVLGDAEAFLREGKKNHNVKNVLAAAIKAAEKENPNDRSVAEAKKVLAQFDAAQFKVGDKVLRKGYPAPSPRDYYKVIEVHPNGSVMLDDGFNGYYSPNLIIRATDSNAEAIVNHDRIPVDQLGGEANARKHGYIIAKKGGRVYGVHIDGYSDKLAKKTIEEAGYTVVGDAAAGVAHDRGDYTTNTIALLKMAFDNLNKAESVVKAVLRNISNAFDKVQDAQAKSSLNNLEEDWSACEREIWETLQQVKRITVPSNYGIPHKAKLSPEDRKFIEAFFG